MPIKIQPDLPAKAILELENIFTMDEHRAMSQDIRPLSILILNLMPLKVETETQILRALSNTPLQVDCTFMHMSTHVSKNTSASHLNKFYVVFHDIRKKKFDGMIITGAPVEHLAFEEVSYWPEMVEILEWSKTHVTSTLHLCWGCQAALYHHYGVRKHDVPEKISGVYKHQALNKKTPLLRGIDDYFMAPHSRNTEVRCEEIKQHPELTILGRSDEVGFFLGINDSGSQIYIQGHPEYDRVTLHDEYYRDLGKGLNPKIPANYYQDDDPSTRPILSWRSTANTLYTNWLNYYVYQVTPFNLDELDYYI